MSTRQKKALLLMLVLMFISTNVYAAFSFVDNGDGTVTDERTGLIWLEDDDCYSIQNWDNAMSSAAGLNDGECGLTDGSAEGDWRLPTKEELQGIGTDPPVTWDTPTPAVTWTIPGFPFNIDPVNSMCWAGIEGSTSTQAWQVMMYNGYSSLNSKNLNLRVWPVRYGDSDDDGVNDDVDNCPAEANPNQENDDGDALGDVCDPDTVYGYIDLSGAALENVIVRIYQTTCGGDIELVSDTTDSDGYYSFGNLGNGFYHVIPEDIDYTFAPEADYLQIPQPEIQPFDYTATSAP
jgi:hypothetical protein